MRDLAVKIAIKLGLYKWIVEKLSKFGQRKKSRIFRKYGYETLVKADEVFRSVGAKMFIDFGTLLGAYRDKAFIPYDFDLDVGLWHTERPDNLVELMQKYGFKHKRQFYIKETNVITEDQFEYKGVQIDVFYYMDYDDSRVFCYCARHHETKEWKEANATDGFPCVKWPCERTFFSEKDFLGHNFYMPDKAESWLRDVYGEDFMTPIKSWTEKNRKTVMVKSKERLYRR